jgi:hypothetical protein
MGRNLEEFCDSSHRAKSIRLPNLPTRVCTQNTSSRNWLTARGSAGPGLSQFCDPKGGTDGDRYNRQV